jgi:hypothetical protein
MTLVGLQVTGFYMEIPMAEYLQMTLRECAQYDKKNGLKEKLTGWGIICKDRKDRGISRKERRLAREKK